MWPLSAYGFAFGPRGRFLVSTFGRTPGVAEPVWTLAGEAALAEEQPVGAAVLPEGDLVLFERAGGLPAWRLRPAAGGTRWDVQRAR